MTKTAAITTALTVALTLTACGPNGNERNEFINQMAEQGATAGNNLKTRGEQPTTQRCDQARAALGDALVPAGFLNDINYLTTDEQDALLAEGNRAFNAACAHAGRATPTPAQS